MIGIYKIISPSGKIYIGQSWNISKRWEGYKRCNPKHIVLYNSFNKYGFDNHKFEIIHELPNDISQDILNNYEVLYWEFYKNAGFSMLNLREPGRGGKLSEDTRKKISLSLIGNKRSLGYKNTDETNKKKRIKLLGRRMSQETKDKIRNSLLGKKHTEERNKNRSEALKNYHKNKN